MNDPGYFQNIIKNFNELRIEKKLVDIKLVVQLNHNTQDEYWAHELILTSSSHFFRVLFDERTKKKRNGQHVDNVLKLEFNDLQPAHFSTIFDYLYTGKIKCTKENVTSLYKYSKAYVLESLKPVIIEFMKNNVTLDTWLEYWRFTRYEKNPALDEECEKFCKKSYKDIFNKETIEKIELEELEDIVRILEINLHEQHSTVFTIITSWIRTNESDKIHYLFKLTECNVRLIVESILYLYDKHRVILKDYLKNLKKGKLEEVCTHPNIRHSQNISLDCIIEWTKLGITSLEECKPLFNLIDYHEIDSKILRSKITYEENPEIKNILENESLKVTSQVGTEPGLVKNSEKSKKGKKFHKSNDIKSQDIFIISYDGILKYDRDDRIFKTKLAYETQNGFAAIPMKDNNHILISDSKSFHRYSRELNEIKKLSSMETNRMYHNMIEFKDEIYACGGLNSKTVEVYNIRKNSWETLSSEMKFKRNSFKMAEYNNSLYMFGGYDDSLLLAPGIERYDPGEGKWMAIERSEILDVNFYLRTHSTSFLCKDSIYIYYRELTNGAVNFGFKAKKFDLKMNKWMNDGLDIPNEFFSEACRKFDANSCNNGPICITTVNSSQIAEAFMFKPQTENWEKIRDFYINNYPQNCTANLIGFTE